jgi:hypothetical protein
MRKIADASCGMALALLSYDLFIGSASLTEHQANVSYYTRDPATSKYGWAGTSCQALAPFICEVEAQSYPCPSPPSPPSQPDEPEMLPPDAPQFAQYCEWLTGSCFGCVHRPPCLADSKSVAGGSESPAASAFHQQRPADLAA